MTEATGIQAVETAVEFVLSNNFDAKSQPCLLTCVKLIDNLIRKPTNPTFQTIKLTNPAIQSKIGECKGGVDVLRSCGFQNDPTTAAACLVVSSSNPPSSSFLLSSRGYIARRCIQDLRVPADQIARTPVPPPPASAATTQFDAYSSHRVAVGASGQQQQQQPYVSSTETQLARLERQQAQLEKRLAAKPLDRAWRATRPGERTTLPTASDTTAGASSSSGDAKLVAARLQAQQQQGSTDAPLTTAAMRRVAKLNNQKVYSHTTLQILCPNGVTLTGNFRPGDTVATVVEALQTDCFNDPTAAPFQLYVTPPRRNLDASATLLVEGLVPAAKIYVRWTTAVTGMVRESLFAVADASSFPTAHAIAPTAATGGAAGKPKAATGTKKETKEEAMLRRMMGSSNTSKRPPSNAAGGRGGSSTGGGKPKWFKG